jgi:hypothetical protein
VSVAQHNRNGKGKAFHNNYIVILTAKIKNKNLNRCTMTVTPGDADPGMRFLQPEPERLAADPPHLSHGPAVPGAGLRP